MFGEIKAGQGIWEHSKEEEGSRERSLTAKKEVRIEACEQNKDKLKGRRGQA